MVQAQTSWLMMVVMPPSSSMVSNNLLVALNLLTLNILCSPQWYAEWEWDVNDYMVVIRVIKVMTTSSLKSLWRLNRFLLFYCLMGSSGSEWTMKSQDQSLISQRGLNLVVIRSKQSKLPTGQQKSFAPSWYDARDLITIACMTVGDRNQKSCNHISDSSPQL